MQILSGVTWSSLAQNVNVENFCLNIGIKKPVTADIQTEQRVFNSLWTLFYSKNVRKLTVTKKKCYFRTVFHTRI